MRHKLASRKLWAATVTALALWLTALTGVDLDLDQVLSIVLPVVAYILGEAWIDGRK